MVSSTKNWVCLPYSGSLRRRFEIIRNYSKMIFNHFYLLSGDCIYLFACKYDRMELKPTETIPPYLIKWTFNLQTGSCDEEQLFDLPFEWPRINEAYTGIKFNYGYVLTQRPFLPKVRFSIALTSCT
jgi:carotenoid cleavage dioxygenase-like enzyme